MRGIRSLMLCVYLLVCLSVVFSQEEISYIGEIAWSPANELLVSAPSGLYLYSAGTIQPLSTYPTNHPAFSPDGSLLAYAIVSHELPEVVVQRSSDDQPLFSFTVDADRIGALAFNLDSSLLAVVLNRPGQEPWQSINTTEIWSISTQQRIRILDLTLPQFSGRRKCPLD